MNIKMIVFTCFACSAGAQVGTRVNITHDQLILNDPVLRNRFTVISVETETVNNQKQIKVISSSNTGIVIHKLTNEDAIRIRDALNKALESK